MNVKSRTLPNCARCSNHGLKIKIRAHKRFCAYRYCNCEKCKITNDRQRDMALQTALRRAHVQDESRVLLQGQIPQQPMVPLPIVIKNEFVNHEIDEADNDRPDSGFDAREFYESGETSQHEEEPMDKEPGILNSQFIEEHLDIGKCTCLFIRKF